MNEQDYFYRRRQFDELTQKLGREDIIVHRVIEAYAHGSIVTKEEALCQMVVYLSHDWKREQDKYMEIIRTNVFPQTIRPHE
jgi:hypothetical protein